MVEAIQEIAEAFTAILNHPLSSIIANQELLALSIEFTQFSNSGIFASGNQITGKLVLEKILIYTKKIEKIAEKTKHKSKNYYKKKLSIILKKLKYLIDHIEASCKLPLDDLACISDDHIRKIALKNITTTLHVENKEKLEQEMNAFNKRFDLLKAIIQKILQYKNSLSRDLMAG